MMLILRSALRPLTLLPFTPQSLCLWQMSQSV